MQRYVHGYSRREAKRLTDQADTLADLLHTGTTFRPGARVLECGCGTGSQTLHLARRNPRAQIISLDKNTDSLRIARSRLEDLGITNVRLQQGDIYSLPFRFQTFDDAFVCFVLEHLPAPEKALTCIRDMLKPGGRLTLIEGDHGSWYCHPETPAARRNVECLIKVQAAMQGDALIGRRLFPLLRSSGFNQVQVTPRMVYVDHSRPDLVEGFSRNTFIAMVASVEDKAVEMGLIGRGDWRRGIDDLYRATGPEGTFCYTFFKATAEKGR